MLFTIGALRAIVEMLGLCLLAQAVLYLLCGRQRAANPIYRLFALITDAPRRLAARLLPAGAAPRLAGTLCFILLFAAWIGLAWLRKSV
ncbi:hypothetical protein [Azonexus sp.]|jgi:hypothetical protein|uniref:hypothetical protein n=1 Tax=Azonexus sp. TaxID=1872668 RepID=UPI002832BB81|nr:hypothetical protein [Azonexus sp.]MDR1995869.1 hypothetical protein [Azonexus sp.]